MLGANKAKSLLQDNHKLNDLFEKVMHKLGNISIPVIGNFISDIPILIDMIKAYTTKEYTDIPLATILTATITLIYFVSPIDIIPDFIPLIGKLDDIAIITILLKTIHNDVSDYKHWRMKQNRREAAYVV